MGTRYDVDRVFLARCPCGKTAPGALLRVTVPPWARVVRWFRPPVDWFVAVADDPKTEDGRTIEGPFVRCPDCIRLEPYPASQMMKGPQATAAERRPTNFGALSAQEQWDIDKRLGILDWDGSPEK